MNMTAGDYFFNLSEPSNSYKNNYYKNFLDFYEDVQGQVNVV